MFHDHWVIPRGSHRKRGRVEWPRIALDWKVSLSMAVDEGPYIHTIEIFEEERQRFKGNMSDVVGDITFIVLPGGFRSLLDDAFVP